MLDEAYAKRLKVEDGADAWPGAARPAHLTAGQSLLISTGLSTDRRDAITREFTAYVKCFTPSYGMGSLPAGTTDRALLSLLATMKRRSGVVDVERHRSVNCQAEDARAIAAAFALERPECR